MPLVICGICNKEFYIKPSHQKLGWGKYCSRECVFQSQHNGKFVKCSTCDTEIYRALRLINRSKSGKYFCSKSCQTLWRNKFYIGENSINWKNGESAYRNILRRSGKEKSCRLCGISDERVLNAHHIDHNRKNNKIENLTWLCLNCHYLTHHDRILDKQVREK